MSHPDPIPLYPRTARAVVGWINPAVLVALLAGLAAAGCAAVAVVQILAAPGAALLAAGLLTAGGWLVKAILAVVPLPVLAGLALAGVVSPWLLLAVLACLALRAGGRT